MSSQRKISFKAPPTVLTDTLQSQESRRAKALEEQKRRRAQKVDACRNLDSFAHLTLGPSDDEEETALDESADIVREGVASFAAMLHRTDLQAVSDGSSDTTSMATTQGETTCQENQNRSKNRRRRNKTKPSKWADKCMYAELLEMRDDQPWINHCTGSGDGLPPDLESGWVAVAPVPQGKRCLAVTHQSAGIVGTSPNTTLRSRVLGKSLMRRFPSSLPPLTILDCILDTNWRDNGLLHVLDVIKWKGQDVGDCETSFRFWYRDARLAELAPYPPPSSFVPQNHQPSKLSVSLPDDGHAGISSISPVRPYHFPYPTSFVPIPYHADTTLSFLSSYVIPFSRTIRHIPFEIPAPQIAPHLPSYRAISISPRMDIDLSTSQDFRLSSSSSPQSALSSKSGSASAGSASSQLRPLSQMFAAAESDGLLLYVMQASYEPGTSPLSCWIPCRASEDDHQTNYQPTAAAIAGASVRLGDSPLDIFERLVNKRLANGHHKQPNVTPNAQGLSDAIMDMET